MGTKFRFKLYFCIIWLYDLRILLPTVSELKSIHNISAVLSSSVHCMYERVPQAPLTSTSILLTIIYLIPTFKTSSYGNPPVSFLRFSFKISNNFAVELFCWKMDEAIRSTA